MSILWIVDRDAPNLEEGLRRVPADGPTNIVIDIHRSSQLLQTVATIRGRVQRPVSLVRFLSHGRAGELLFSNETLNISNAGGLRFLRGVISPSRLIGTAGIEFHGCGVASDYLPPPRVEQGIGNVVVQNFGNMQGQLG